MSRNRPAKIALIDSHSLMRECLHNYLSAFGYSINLQAADGKELIEQLTIDNVPDICLLEFNSRKKEGFETIKMLKAAWPHLKIVIYSMHAGPVEGKTQVSGADMVITNHSSLAEFKYVLDQLLKQQGALAE